MTEGGRRLEGRVALVTGASRGIGAEVAVAYAEAGAHVVLVARTQGGLTDVDDRIRALGGAATLCPVDLRKGDRIDALGVAILERFGKLDILVGNAGTIGQLSPIGHIPPRTWDEVFAVNVTANWRLIRIMDPLLRRSDAGRAIFTTSGAASGAFAYWSAYAASKAALETMVAAWAKELANTNVRANLLDPGTVATAMRAQAYPGEDPATLRPPAAVAPVFVDLAAADCQLNGQVARAYD